MSWSIRFPAALVAVWTLGCSAPEAERGVTRPAAVYEDLGPAPDAEIIRAVVELEVRDRPGLDALARDVYDPRSPIFRRYLDRDALRERFLPTDEDVATAKQWAEARGLRAGFVSANRLLLELSGPARAFDQAFTTTIHAYRHDGRDDRVFGTPGGVQIPPESHLSAVVALDVPAKVEAPPETPVEEVPPATTSIGYLPEQIAHAYETTDLATATRGGRAAKIALAIGGGFRSGDARAFWAATRIDRAPAVVREVGGPPSFRGLEGTMLVEWAGALAPSSDLLVFQGPDSRVSSTLLAFNEAIASGEANVVAFSHSRHESSEPEATRNAFDLAAELGAVAGVTVVAASGDTAKPDVPATCPFVTAVGGTLLYLDGDVIEEEAWGRSGSGLSAFTTPWWQIDMPDHAAGKRATPDVALNAGVPYAVFHEGQWKPGGGTSLAAPVFASLVALVDADRIERGAPPVGFLNPALYGSDDVKRSFRDVTTGGTREHAAISGWDFPTGWGAPRLPRFAAALP